MCTLLLLGCCSFFIAPLVVSKFYFLTEPVKLDRERHLDNELERSEKKIIELEREIGELRVQLALKETVAKGDAEGGKTGGADRLGGGVGEEGGGGGVEGRVVPPELPPEPPDPPPPERPRPNP